MRQAQSYIVRVYVRTRTSGLMGTVEIVRTGERRGFSSPDELLSIVMGGNKAAGTVRPAPRTRAK
jgi:hypothetical protein